MGSSTFTVAPDGSLQQRNYRGNVSIEARDVTVDVPKKRLIEAVSLTVYPSEFVGLMGPSGAGKTTLVEALLAHTATIPRAGTIGDGALDRRHHE